MNNQSIPYHTLTPHLVVRGAAQAIEFYGKAFGARETSRLTAPDGKSIVHAELIIGDSRLFLADEVPGMGCLGPLSTGGSPVTIHINTEEIDALFNRAVDAGAEVRMPLADMFWGDRYGVVADPFGHQWSFAKHIEDLTPDEIRKRAEIVFKNYA
jgi:PhnB protein